MRLRGWTRIAGLLVAVLVLATGMARAADVIMPDGDLPSEDAAAVLEAVSGIVEVQRDGEWFAGEEGAELALEDQVRTDADSFARVRFLDDDADAGAEATILDLSPDTTIAIEELAVEHDEEGTRRHGLVGMIRGAINAITKGWGSGSLFSVRAGTTVCGIRGSVANVGYDPESEEATVTSLDGEMYTFEARDRRDAFMRTRAASRELRRNRRAGFLQQLAPGNQHQRGRKGRVQRRKIAREHFQAARRAALDSRRGGIHKARKRLNQFAKVRAPKRRPGRMAKRRLDRRIRRQDRRDGRRPAGIRKRIRDRLQDGPSGQGLGRGVHAGKNDVRKVTPKAVPRQLQKPTRKPGLKDRRKTPVKDRMRQRMQDRRKRALDRKKRLMRRKR